MPGILNRFERLLKHLFRAHADRSARHSDTPVCRFGPGGDFVQTWPAQTSHNGSVCSSSACKPREHVKGNPLMRTSGPTPAGAPHPRRGHTLLDVPLCIFGPGGEFTTVIHPRKEQRQ